MCFFFSKATVRACLSLVWLVQSYVFSLALLYLWFPNNQMMMIMKLLLNINSILSLELLTSVLLLLLWILCSFQAFILWLLASVKHTQTAFLLCGWIIAAWHWEPVVTDCTHRPQGDKSHVCYIYIQYVISSEWTTDNVIGLLHISKISTIWSCWHMRVRPTHADMPCHILLK